MFLRFLPALLGLQPLAVPALGFQPLFLQLLGHNWQVSDEVIHAILKTSACAVVPVLSQIKKVGVTEGERQRAVRHMVRLGPRMARSRRSSFFFRGGALIDKGEVRPGDRRSQLLRTTVVSEGAAGFSDFHPVAPLLQSLEKSIHDAQRPTGRVRAPITPTSCSPRAPPPVFPGPLRRSLSARLLQETAKLLTRLRLASHRDRPRYQRHGKHRALMDRVERERRLQALFSKYASEVLAYGMRRGASRLDAEDVMIETFVVCYRRLDELPDPGLAWLLAVARRVLANQRRARTRHSALLDKIETYSDPTGPAVELPGDMGDQEFMFALAALSEVDRETLFLVAWEGLTHEEAAQVVGRSRSAFTRRFKHACRRLHAQLERDRTQEAVETEH